MGENLNDQSDNKPPQRSNVFYRIFLYIKHWLRFHFFFKNMTMQESVNNVIDELSMFGNRKIKPEEETMIKDLLDFYDLTIEEIKIPRNEISAVEELELDKVFDLMREKKTSRIPVYKKDLDNIIGFLNVKDLFAYFKENGNLLEAHSLIEKILFVPPSMKALDLLIRMKKTKIHIAAIIDEYGGTDGIITINDIISEIVGTLDEDVRDDLINKISPNEFMVSGRAELDELKEKFNIDLYDEEHDDIETVNGLIFSIHNTVPEIDEIISFPNGFQCIVKEVTDRMVVRVIISKYEKTESAE